jgi:hypothetical protein
MMTVQRLISMATTMRSLRSMMVGGAWTVRREAEPPPPLPRERKVGGRVRECGGRACGKKKWAGCAAEWRADRLERRKKADEVLLLLSFFLEYIEIILN